MRNLKGIILEALQEKQRYGKEKGTNYDTREQTLKPLFVQAEREKNLYVQYSNIDKLGLNPQSEYNTPLGIYGYPAYIYTYDMIVNGQVEFAGDRKYVVAFKAQTPSKLLIVDKNGKISSASGVKESQLEGLWNSLHPETIDPRAWDRGDLQYRKDFYTRKTKEHPNAPGKAFFYAVHELADSLKPGAASRMSPKLFLKMGIQGVVDEGSGTIHENEPIQAVFFSAGYIKRLGVVFNKNEKALQRQRGKKRYKTLKGKKVQVPSERIIKKFKSFVENLIAQKKIAGDHYVKDIKSFFEIFEPLAGKELAGEEYSKVRGNSAWFRIANLAGQNLKSTDVSGKDKSVLKVIKIFANKIKSSWNVSDSA